MAQDEEICTYKKGASANQVSQGFEKYAPLNANAQADLMDNGPTANGLTPANRVDPFEFHLTEKSNDFWLQYKDKKTTKVQHENEMRKIEELRRLEKKKRWCLHCNSYKIWATHHCSVCNTCVVRMDHHCPWLMNCIGYNNQRFFL